MRAGTGLDRGHRRLYVGMDFERLAAGVDQEVDLVDRQPEPGGDLVQLRLGWRVEVGEGKVLDYKADTRGRRRS